MGEPVVEVEPVVVEPAVARPSHEMVAVSPGFLPDPITVTGSAGGSDDASSRDVSCVGFVAQSPNHVLVVRHDFTWLRVMVRSTGDTTLVIRAPDGRMLCNDDFEGLDPGVEGPFPAGDYEVWVGTYEQGTRHDYRFGVTELSNVTPSSL